MPVACLLEKAFSLRPRVSEDLKPRLIEKGPFSTLRMALFCGYFW